MPIVPLELLAAGEAAKIVDIEGDPGMVSRLHEMGLNIDTEITMVQSGEPCIIAVGNHRLSIRCEELVVILVET
ncbi:MAG: FeoA domain-containing protein [Planctomycetota bacterium]|nr:FeoA domain-containing protein [Planctomycetota bacterium]MDA1249547.1 FeoA domain-containing protein [Planctomycetota bacterium]